MPPARSALAVALLVSLPATGCTIGGDIFPPFDASFPDAGPRDAGRDAGPEAGPDDAGIIGIDAGPPDAGPPVTCVPGPSEREAPLAMSSASVVLDGAFTGSEWEGVVPLEGLYADVYIDRRGGDLLILTDWRANEEGVAADCFARFDFTIGGSPSTVRLFGDGSVEVDGAGRPVSGAVGLGPSPLTPTPHTIYELRVADVFERVDACLFGPLALGSCAAIAHEPMIFGVVPGIDEAYIAQRSTRSSSLTRLSEGAACGNGDGVCAGDLECSAPAPDRRCVPD